MTVLDFIQRKNSQSPLSMVTCYDFSFAQIVNQTDIDAILVGDSLAMVMHGHTSTIPATMTMMELHTKAVVKGAPDKLVIADMPFLSNRKGLKHGMDCIDRLMKAGAQAVKLEGADGKPDLR